jgi:hypothetical protein
VSSAEDDALLRASAAGFAEVTLAAVKREYPNHLRHVLEAPDDRPLPHELHSAFYGCFDWHSAVEMHRALVRLLRTVPEELPEAEVRPSSTSIAPGSRPAPTSSHRHSSRPS